MLKALERFKMTLAYYLKRRDIKYKFNKVLEKNKRKYKKMGGRGASSGISKKRNVYGSQFHAVKDSNGKALVSGNVKFIQSNSRDSESLMETMTKGRVYALTGGDDLIKIVYFDKENKHVKEINFGHKHAGLDPHVHHGYFHNENDGKKGATRLTKEEKKMVESVEKVWHAYLSRR